MDTKISIRLLFSSYLVAGAWFNCKAEKDRSFNDGATSDLFVAVERNDPTETRDAIENGANIEAKNSTGFTPLHLAAAEGHVAAMSLLLRANGNKETVTNAGDRPLHIAATLGNDEAVAMLAVAGADLRAGGQGGVTPLQRAAGHNSTVALLNALLNSHVRSGNGTSDEATEALWDAVRSNDPEAIIAALEKGAKIDWRNAGNYSNTALILAAGSNHVEAMSVLLKAGADREALNRIGDRPIHEAVTFGRDVAVALLSVAGANLHTRGYESLTPLQKAVRAGHSSTIALIRALGGWR